jgi:hypothetical protein
MPGMGSMVYEICEVCGAHDGQKHDAKSHGADEKLAAEHDAYGPKQD